MYSASVLAPIVSPARWVLRRLLRPWLVRQDEENRFLLERIDRLREALEERDEVLRREIEAARDASRREARPLRKALFGIQRRLSRGNGGALATRTARLEADAARQASRLEKLRQLLAIGNDAFLVLRREGHPLLSESVLPERLVPAFLPALAVTADLRTGGIASAHARTLSAKLEGSRLVVDLGCGTGEFLEELARLGVPALGVDADPKAVAACRQRGMDAQEGDLFEVLQGERLPAFDGAVLSHVVEHVDPIEALRLFLSIGSRLPEGGLLLVVTPNPESLFTHLVHFWRDPTHVRPYPVELLRRFAAVTGFAVVEAGEVPETSEVDWLL